LDFILFKFIFTYFNFIQFFFCSKDFFNYYIRIYWWTQSVGIFQRWGEQFTSYATTPLLHHRRNYFRRYFTNGWNKITINATVNHRRNNYVDVLKRVIFLVHFPSVKPSVFFFTDRNDITDKYITDKRFPFINLSVNFVPTDC
jgi:hypothetical protein